MKYGFLFIFIVTFILQGFINIYAYNKQHVRKLLSTGNCQSCDLSDIDLSNRNLKGLDVSGSDLSDAILRNCNLNEGNFQNSNLTRAKLENTTIENASFDRANLSWTRFDLAKLKNSSFYKANMKETNLSGADLRNTSLKGSIFIGVRMNLTYFKDAIWHDGIKCKIGSIGKCVK